MDATKLLEQQHREVADLFERCLDESSEQFEREGAFGELADAFAAHCEIEEKIFYPSVFVGDLKEKLRESVEEHLAAKRLCTDILDADISDETWRAKVTVLKEEIDHHVSEEEDTIFPRIRDVFSMGELDAMGDEMEELASDLKTISPAEGMRTEVERGPNLDEETGHA